MTRTTRKRTNLAKKTIATHPARLSAMLLLLAVVPFTAATQQGFWWNMSAAVASEGLSYDEHVTAFAAQGLFHKYQRDRDTHALPSNRPTSADGFGKWRAIAPHNQTLMMFDIGQQNYDCESVVPLLLHTALMFGPMHTRATQRRLLALLSASEWPRQLHRIACFPVRSRRLRRQNRRGCRGACGVRG